MLSLGTVPTLQSVRSLEHGTLSVLMKNLFTVVCILPYGIEWSPNGFQYYCCSSQVCPGRISRKVVREIAPVRSLGPCAIRNPIKPFIMAFSSHRYHLSALCQLSNPCQLSNTYGTRFRQVEHPPARAHAVIKGGGVYRAIARGTHSFSRVRPSVAPSA